MTESEIEALHELLLSRPSIANIAKVRIALRAAARKAKPKPKLAEGEAKMRRRVGRARARIVALQKQIAAAQSLIVEQRIHTPVYCGPYSREPFRPTIEHLCAEGSLPGMQRELEWHKQNWPNICAELTAEAECEL
jgi:hypothetical protein